MVGEGGRSGMSVVVGGRRVLWGRTALGGARDADWDCWARVGAQDSMLSGGNMRVLKGVCLWYVGAARRSSRSWLGRSAISVDVDSF